MISTLILMAVSSVLILGGVIWVDHRLHVPPIRSGFVEGFRQITIRQAVIAIAIQAYFLALYSRNSGVDSPVFIFGMLVAFTFFVRIWAGEFNVLMGLRDADFPGRHDKLVWVFVLLALAPVGVWVFRAFRLEHWPVEAADAADFAAASAPRKSAVDPLS